LAVILCGCLSALGAGCVPVPVRWTGPQTLPAAIRFIDQDTLLEVREALVLTVWRSSEGTWVGESYFGSTSDRLIRPQVVNSGDRFFPDHGILHWEVEWWPWPASTTRKEERFYRLVAIAPGYEAQTTDLSSRDESALDIWPRHVDVRLKAAAEPRAELERIRHLLLNRSRLSSKDRKQWAIMGEYPLRYSKLDIAFTPAEQRFIDQYLTKSIGDLALLVRN
jgi:hypothetical protein